MIPGALQHPDVLELLGSTSHYDDPAVYDHAYADRTADIDVYVAACRGVGRVLEYGCGNGRITIPLARSGCEVVAVDRSGGMLADLRRKLADEPQEVRDRVTIVHGDLRSVRVSGRYTRVLCTFNTLLHLYRATDAIAFFRTVRGQLSSEGRFLFDALVPSLDDLAADPEKPRRGRTVKHPADGRKYRYTERFAYEPLEQVLYVTLTWDPVGEGERREVLLAHRQYFPAELAALLEVAGLEVESVLGDFDGEVDPRDADALLWTCRPTAQ